MSSVVTGTSTNSLTPYSLSD